MGRPRAPKQAVAAALEDVSRGATQAEAAKRHGIGRATLERAIAEQKAEAPAKPRKATTTPGTVTYRVSLDSGRTVTPTSDDDGDADLLAALKRELIEARRERRNPGNTDAEKRAWAKTIRELVSAIERIAPPPPVPPDKVAEELRRLDGVTIDLVEQFLAEPIDPKEIPS